MSRYDTAAIRSLANRLSNTASNLSSTGRNAAARIGNANDNLLGDTARAIDNSVDRLSEEIQSIRNGLSRCAEVLYRYARDLDEADAAASRMIQSH